MTVLYYSRQWSTPGDTDIDIDIDIDVCMYKYGMISKLCLKVSRVSRGGSWMMMMMMMVMIMITRYIVESFNCARGVRMIL